MQYRTIIVEDDPMISQLNRAYVERDPRFQVVECFGDGRSALRWLEEHQADLALLDVYMPRFSGLELLRELRGRAIAVEVIMVTAASDTGTVDALLHLGVSDYLVKPFTIARFQQALDKFCAHREAVAAAGGSMSQSEVDRLLSAPQSAGAALPKGYLKKTLELVRACLREAETSLSSEAVAARTGLSAVTARRYVNYLAECGEAVSTVDYDTGGRPSRLYSLPKGGTSPAAPTYTVER